MGLKISGMTIIPHKISNVIIGKSLDSLVDRAYEPIEACGYLSGNIMCDLIQQKSHIETYCQIFALNE